MEDTEERQCLVSAQSEENVASSESQESHESSEERSKRTEEVGAGWYAWLVVCCSFTCVCVLDGIGYSFGVFFETLLHDLSGGQGRGVLSIAGGLQVGVYGLASPVVARLVDRYGERRCCVAGGLVSALGLGLASTASSIPGLILAYSVVTGVGFGLLYLPSVVIVPKYFVHKHRGLATGVVLCAAGVGTFLVAPLAQLMLDSWGWRGAMQGLALLAGVLCTLCGCFMAPPPSSELPPIPQAASATSGSEVKRSALERLLGAPLACSPGLLMALAMADLLSTLSLYIPYTHLPSAVQAHGVTSSQAAMLISSIGASNSLGRLASGWVCDQVWASPLVTITVGITAAAPCLFLLSVLAHFWLLMVTASVFGLVTGLWLSAMPPSLISLLGIRGLGTGFGLLTLTRGLAAMSGPPLAGMVVDSSGLPYMALLVAGVGMSASCALFTLVTLQARREQRRREYHQL